MLASGENNMCVKVFIANEGTEITCFGELRKRIREHNIIMRYDYIAHGCGDSDFYDDEDCLCPVDINRTFANEDYLVKESDTNQVYYTVVKC